MTFSLLGHCPKTGQFAAAVATSSIAVGARCPYVGRHLGGVLTQYRTDPRMGPRGLQLLESGCSAQEALAALVASSDRIEWRQLAIMDSSGRTAAYTGAKVRPHLGEMHGASCVAIGNILANDDVLPRMIAAFEESADELLPERTMRALEAGNLAGGEGKPVRSAVLIVHGEHAFPLVNLRVDWSPESISDLRAAWNAYRPQIDDYVTRALWPERIV